MTQRAAYYHVMIGSPGCIADSHEFYLWESRRAMVADVNRLLDFYGFPQRARRQVNLVAVWRHIQCGGMRGSFTLRGGMGNRLDLEFRQLDAASWYRESAVAA